LGEKIVPILSFIIIYLYINGKEVRRIKVPNEELVIQEKE